MLNKPIERERETDRQTDRQTETDREREFYTYHLMSTNQVFFRSDEY